MPDPYLLPQEAERDVLSLASRSKLLLFGEIHGTQEVPRVVAGLLPSLRSLGYQGLALEAPYDIRDALAAWTAGATPQPVPPAFFSSPSPDGRGNAQVLSLVQEALHSRHDWTVLCFDQGVGQQAPRWADRDLWMARNLLAQWRKHCPQAKVVGICGNVHSRLVAPVEVPRAKLWRFFRKQEQLWPSFADWLRRLEPELAVGSIAVIPHSGSYYNTGVRQIRAGIGRTVDNPETRQSSDGSHSLELHLPKATPVTFLAEPKTV